MNAKVAEVFVPADFCAIVIASFKVVLTFEDKALLIVERRGIDPVMLESGEAVVEAVVAFLDAVLLVVVCANTSELTAAVKSTAAAITIAPHDSTFLLCIRPVDILSIASYHGQKIYKCNDIYVNVSIYLFP